jgi:hypothetical protein
MRKIDTPVDAFGWQVVYALPLRLLLLVIPVLVFGVASTALIPALVHWNSPSPPHLRHILSCTAGSYCGPNFHFSVCIVFF